MRKFAIKIAWQMLIIYRQRIANPLRQVKKSNASHQYQEKKKIKPMLNKELEKAVLLGDTSLTKALLANKCNIDAKDKYGRTLLYDAILKGFTDIVEELCLARINVNHQDNNGKTPLHFASLHNKLDIARILIRYGADVNLKDENGNTALFDAIFNSKGKPDIILLLKENGADYQTPNNYGVSPKQLAETIENFDVSYLFK